MQENAENRDCNWQPTVCVCVCTADGLEVRLFLTTILPCLILHFGRAKVARIHAQRHACTRTGHGQRQQLQLVLQQQQQQQTKQQKCWENC